MYRNVIQRTHMTQDSIHYNICENQNMIYERERDMYITFSHLPMFIKICRL